MGIVMDATVMNDPDARMHGLQSLHSAVQDGRLPLKIAGPAHAIFRSVAWNFTGDV